MKHLIMICFLFSSCATIPPQSVKLMDQVEAAGKSMHTLNKQLLNKMFRQKNDAVNDFIAEKYTPTFAANIVKQLPVAQVDTAQLSIMLTGAIPEINKRRNAMLGSLEAQRQKLVAKLDEDYATYQQATSSLKSLLQSAVKIETEKEKAYTYIRELSHARLDLNKVEDSLDAYLLKAGDFGADMKKTGKELSKMIDLLLK